MGYVRSVQLCQLLTAGQPVSNVRYLTPVWDLHVSQKRGRMRKKENRCYRSLRRISYAPIIAAHDCWATCKSCIKFSECLGWKDGDNEHRPGITESDRDLISESK